MNPTTYLLAPVSYLLLAIMTSSCSAEQPATEASVPTADRVMRLEDKHNYSFSSGLSIQSTAVRPRANLRFDWSAVGTDMLGQPVDPRAGIDMLEVVLFGLSEKQLMQALNDDTLSQSVVEAFVYYPTQQATTSAEYLGLLAPGGVSVAEEQLLGYLDPERFPSHSYTFATMLAQGIQFGKGTRMLQLLKPVSGENNDQVVLTDESTHLTYTVDLHSATRLAWPAGDSDIVLDWSGSIKYNALAREFIPTQIREVIVANYLTRGLDELERQFLDLEHAADVLYRAEITTGASIRLSELKSDAGEPFHGVSTSGVWIVALLCGGCSNPAPWFLSVVEAG